MASACARVHCGRCKRRWNVLWRDIKSEYANVCPFCGEEIPRDIWEKDVARALGAVQDANMELEKQATGYKGLRFKVDYFAD